MNAADKLFWLFFMAVGILIAVTLVATIPAVDILLGLIIIMFGLQKLGEDYKNKKILEEQNRIKESLNNISKLISDSHDFTAIVKDSTDTKVSEFAKRAEYMEQKIEDNYKGIAKKVLELENKLNEIARVFVKQETVRSGRRK